LFALIVLRLRGRSIAPRWNRREWPLSYPWLMPNTFTAVFERAKEGGYVAFVEELPGAITEGETLEEARENLKEAIQLILEANRELALKDVDRDHIIRERIVVGE
jgi:predicted RNase H-like HicB family nuclease